MPDKVNDFDNEDDAAVIDEAAEEKAGKFNMKRFFKTPEEVNAIAFLEFVQKRLKKAMDVTLKDAPFFFVTNYKFADREDAPMLFVGSPTTFWKQAIKDDFRRRKEFAMGTCTIDNTGDEKKLKLTVTSGKGQRDVNLRLLNKVLLKRLKVVAEFVSGETTDTKLGSKDLPEIKAEAIGKEGSIFNRIQQETVNFKSIPPDDMQSRSEQVRLLNALIAEYELTYKNNPHKGQSDYVNKVKEYLKKAANQYSDKNLQKSQVAEFKTAFDEYVQEKAALDKAINEFVKLRQSQPQSPEIQKKNTAIGNTFLSLYQELVGQEQAIARYMAENHDSISKDDKKELDALLVKIRSAKNTLRVNGGSKLAGQFDNLDKTKLQDYQTDKAYNTAELKKLSGETKLPEMESFLFGSGAYKKIVDAHKEYGKLPDNDVDMKRVKLLQINALIKEWEEKHNKDNSPKEFAQVKKIKDELWNSIQKLTTFSALRDEFPFIMDMYREFQILKEDYRKYVDFENSDEYTGLDKLFADPEAEDASTREHLAGKIEKNINDINDKISKWQSHFTNLSGFGTKKQNQQLEAIRKDISEFLGWRKQALRSEETANSLKSLTGKQTAEAEQNYEAERKKATEEFYKNPENRAKIADIKKRRGTEDSKKKDLTKQRDELQRQIQQNSTAISGYEIELQEADKLSDPSLKTTKKTELQTKITNLQNQNVQLDQQLKPILTQLGETHKKIEAIDKEAANLATPLAQKLVPEQNKKEQTITENRVKTLVQLAIETAKILHPNDIPKQQDAAKQLAADLVKKEKLPADAQKDLFASLDNNSAYVNSGADGSVIKEAQELAKKMGAKEFAYNDINDKVKVKRTYDAKNDKAIPWLEKELLNIKQMSMKGLISGVTKLNKERLDKIEKWRNNAGIWESQVSRYLPSKELDANAKKVTDWRKQCQEIESEAKHIAKLDEAKNTIEKMEASIEAEQKNIKGWEKEKLKLQNSSNAKDKERLKQVLTFMSEARARVLQKQITIGNCEKDWLLAYNDIKDPYVRQEKLERKGKIEAKLGLDPALVADSDPAKAKKKLTEEAEKCARKNILNATSKGDADTKQKLFDEITTGFKNGVKFFAFKPGDENNEQSKKIKVADIEKLENKIREWNTLVIGAKDDDDYQNQQAQTAEISKIREALNFEKLKFEKAIVIREDAFFKSIEMQYAKIKDITPKTVKPEHIKSVQSLQKSIDIWKKGHSPQDTANLDNYTKLEAIEDKVKILKNSDGGQLATMQLEFPQALKELRDQYAALKKEIGNPDSLSPDDLKYLDYVGTELEKDLKKAADLHAKGEASMPAAIDQLTIADERYNRYAQKMLITSHKFVREKERQVVAPLAGFDVYENFNNIDIPPDQLEKMKAVAAKACARAQKMMETGYTVEEAQQMLEHIPVGLWPDKFLKEMDLWRKAEEMANKKEEEAAEKDPEFNELKTFMKGIQDVNAAFNSYYNADYTVTMNGQRYAGNAFTFQLDTSTTVDTSNSGTATYKHGVGDDVGKATFVINEVFDVKDTLVDLSNLTLPREGETPEENAKRKIAMARFVSTTVQKIVTKAERFTNTFDNGPAGTVGRISSAVLKSVALICNLFNKATEGGDPSALTLKQFFKEQVNQKSIEDAATTLLEVGAAVGDIVSLFNQAGFIVFSGFNLALDIKNFIGAIRKAHQAIKAKNRMQDIENRAIEEDSILQNAMHREVKMAKRKADGAIVDAVGQGVKVVGATLDFAGNACILAGEPHAVGAGVSLRITGQVVKLVGTALMVGKDIAMTFAQELDRQALKGLLKKAKAGDRNARIEVSSKSSFYAKAFIAIKAEEGDPIAMEYCLVNGIKDSDFSDKMKANEILKKLFEVSGESEDERTMGDRFKAMLKSMRDAVSNKWNNLANFQALSLNLNDANQLKSETVKLVASYQSLKKMNTASTIVSIVTAIPTMGASLDLDDEYKAFFKECKEHFNTILTQLAAKETTLAQTIAQQTDLLKNTLSQQSKTASAGTSEADVNAAIEIEEKLVNAQLLLAEIRNSQADLKALS